MRNATSNASHHRQQHRPARKVSHYAQGIATHPRRPLPLEDPPGSGSVTAPSIKLKHSLGSMSLGQWIELRCFLPRLRRSSFGRKKEIDLNSAKWLPQYEPWECLFHFILTKNIVYTFLSLSENSCRLIWGRLQQPQEQRYPVLKKRQMFYLWYSCHLNCYCSLKFECYWHAWLPSSPFCSNVSLPARE